MMKTTMERNNQRINSVFFAIIAVFVLYICISTGIGRIIRRVTGSLNLPGMMISIGAYLFLQLLFGKIRFRIPAWVILAGSLGLAAFLLRSMSLEPGLMDAPAHLPVEILATAPYVYLPVTMFLGIGGVLISGVLCRLQGKRWIRQALTVAVTALVAGYTVHNHYIKTFYPWFQDIFHVHAYTNSIFNLFWGKPFTETLTSIYGHYALFYVPLLKLAWAFGVRDLVTAYMVISAGISGLTVCLLGVSICRTVKNTWIRILGIIASGYIFTSRLTGVYHQLYPHRIFPIAVIMLMMTFWLRAEKKGRVNLVGYLTCMLMTLWNTECGIVGTVAWAGMNVCRILQHPGKESWGRALLHIAAVAGTFAISVLACGLINLALGGSMLSVSEFLFPLLNHGYMQGTLEAGLPECPSAWMSIMAALLGWVGVGLADTILCHRGGKQSSGTAWCFGMAVFGLGILTYAINRPAYGNFFIIMPIMAVLMAATADRAFPPEREILRSGVKKDSSRFLSACAGSMCCCVLFLIAVSSIINAPFKSERQEMYRDPSHRESIVREMERYGEASDYAAGMGAASAFGLMGWDPKIYTLDISDIDIVPGAVEELCEQIRRIPENKTLFISSDAMAEMDELPKSFLESHTLAGTIEMATPVSIYKPISEQ